MLVLRKGTEKRIVLASDVGGRCHGQEFLEHLDNRDRAKFEPLFTEMSDVGRIHNQERFRKESDYIYCFKAGRHRLACFFDRNDIVIVSGFTKKTNRDLRSKRELEKADKLRRRYIDQRKTQHEF